MNEPATLPEHALLILKPGPLRREVLTRLPVRLAGDGLGIVGVSRLHLTAADVHACFKYTAPPYVAMWTNGVSDAMLVAGPDAPDRAADVRDEMRREFGTSRSDIYNLVHLADTGWEFARQFTLFFPDRPLERYAGFGDLLIHPPFTGMRDQLRRSSVGAVGLVGASERDLDEARSTGVDAIAVVAAQVDGTKLLGVFQNVPAATAPLSSVEAFLDWVHSRGGLVFFDENDDRLEAWPSPSDPQAAERLTPIVLDAYRRQIDACRPSELDGLVVVHPRRSAFLLEMLWEIADEGSFLQIGGSAGAAPPLTMAIDRREVVAVLAALYS